MFALYTRKLYHEIMHFYMWIALNVDLVARFVCLQVTYPMRLAKLLHRAPLLLALAMPRLSFGLALKRQRTLLQECREQLTMAATALLSTICSVVMPVLFSFAFVWLTGKSICCNTQFHPPVDLCVKE